MIVVYTALFGQNDVLYPPKVINPKVWYVCISDRERNVKGWETFTTKETVPPRFQARMVKTTPLQRFPEFTASVWVDASFELLVDPEVIVGETNASIGAFAHPDRATVFQEAAVIMRDGLAHPRIVAEQVRAYQDDGFNMDTGPLTTTGLLVRFHEAEGQREFNDTWHQEVCTRTLRDQLSVDYSAWKADVEIDHWPGHYRDNPFALYHRETHRRSA